MGLKQHLPAKFLVVYLALALGGSHALADPSPLVDVKNLGTVKGTLGKSFFTNRTIYEFFGINYAKSPSGDRRFRPPEEFGPWQGIYDATKMRQRCPQMDNGYYPSPDPGFLNVKKDIEDCLVLNVFTPNIRDVKKKMPVLFYIHGGSFYLGSAYDFLPDFLLEEDIVLVVIQYRLGPLGFLCLNTDEIPGNMGMLDVIMALRWVKNHIEDFGGDPSKITVYGQSAGSMATSSLLLSPLVEKGLFDKIIVSSASVLASLAVDEDPLGSAKNISRLLGCNTENIGEMTKCLKKVPPLDIMKAHANFLSANQATPGSLRLPGASFVVQKPGPGKFLIKHPQVAFSEGPNFRVSVMGGANRDEGSFLLSYLIESLKSINITEVTPYHQRSIVEKMLWFSGYGDTSGLTTDLLQDKYFPGPKTIDFQKVLPVLQDILGTLIIKRPTYDFIRGISHGEKAYSYAFHFLGGISKLKDSDPDWDKKYPFPTGVAHSDELGYIFPSRSKYKERELEMVRTMTRFWTNFVKNGCPVRPCDELNWPIMSTPFGPYLHISEKLQVGNNILCEYVIATKEGFLRHRTHHLYNPFAPNYKSNTEQSNVKLN